MYSFRQVTWSAAIAALVCLAGWSVAYACKEGDCTNLYCRIYDATYWYFPTIGQTSCSTFSSDQAIEPGVGGFFLRYEDKNGVALTGRILTVTYYTGCCRACVGACDETRHQEGYNYSDQKGTTPCPQEECAMIYNQQ